MSQSIPAPVARRLRPGDKDRLARFRCSTGPWFEEDVERFIRERLCAEHDRRSEHLDMQVILLVPADDHEDILAVGAYEIDDQRTEAGVDLEGTRLIVGAVRADVQGVTVDVEPYADGRAVTIGRHLMEVLLDDLPTRPGLVRAIVARENLRSLRLCDRIGLRDERADTDDRFVQRLGKVG